MDKEDISGLELERSRMPNTSTLKRNTGRRYLVAGPNAYKRPPPISAKGPRGSVWNSNYHNWVMPDPYNNNPYSTVSNINTLTLSPSPLARNNKYKKNRKSRKSRKNRKTRKNRK